MKEEELNKITKELIGQLGVEQPSTAFTDNVMAALPKTTANSLAQAPLIGKVSWILIAVGVATLLGLAFVVPSTGASSGQSALPYLELLLAGISSGLSALTAALGTNSVQLVGGFALCALFFAGLDQLLKRRWTPAAHLF